MTRPLQSFPGADRDPVAIVGIGCRFPGASNPTAFWRLLVDGVDAIREIPRDRFDIDALYDERPAQRGKVQTRWGGFVDGLDLLDAEFFGISPREAERLDPQQRMLLETAWEAFEDAGIVPTRLAGSATGVFVGMWINEYESRLFRNRNAIDFHMTTGTGRYAASGRLSYFFGLHGPSLTLDTGCSSSLVAIHLACQSLWSGESELALAGAANAIVEPFVTIAYSQSGMMAPDGRCKFGDAAANGYVRSDGAAIVVLKPLSKAMADGDRIYATILGSAVTNDGRSSGFMTTPAREGQEEMLRRAYRDAGVSPGRVDYVEAHGTGTRAGDPVELGALGAVLGVDRPAGAPCRVGSVKTNIGHTEGAAGMAGLIKTALSLRHRTIPGSLHLHTPNPDIPWTTLPLVIQQQTEAWHSSVEPRIAGVSSFGISGTNAHVVLTEAPAQDRPASCPRAAALTISGHTAEALRAMVTAWRESIAGDPSISLVDACFAAAARRAHHAHRAAFAADRADVLLDQLDAYLSDETRDGVATGQILPGPRVAFVFPGQGSQWVGMGRGLYAAEPAFRTALDRCDAAIAAEAGWSVKSVLFSDAAGAALESIDFIQPALFSVQVSLAALWQSWGVRPDAVVGHSMGEVAAAYVAGALSLADAARVICLRSRLLKRTSGRGAMAVVELSAAEAAAELAGRERQLSIAVCNSSRSTVISGDPAAVDAVLESLESRGVFCRRVKVDVASHSPQMDPLCGDLFAGLVGLHPGAARVPFQSTAVTGTIEGCELDAAYWVKNLRHPVMFGDAIQQLCRDRHTVFIEMSPHPILTAAVREGIADSGITAVAIGSTRRDEDERLSILGSLGAAYVTGLDIDWHAVYPGCTATVPMPLYAFQRERFWFDSPAVRGAEMVYDDAAELAPDVLHRVQWQIQPRETGRNAVAAGGWLIAGGSALATFALQRAFNAIGAPAAILADTSASAYGEALRVQSTAGPIAGVVYLGSTLADRAGSAESITATIRDALELARGAAALDRPLTFVIATRGAQRVRESETVAGADDASLWGFGRTFAEEFPAMSVRLVDVDPQADVDAAMDALASELARDERGAQVALRGGDRYELRLEQLPAALLGRNEFTVRPGRSYLVTGGFGALGLHVARWLAERGARRLILMGRTALPAREAWSGLPSDHPLSSRVKAVQALERMGLCIHHAAVDVADSAAVDAWFSRFRAEGWPAIGGVFHCAGVLAPELIADMDVTTLERVLDPKVRGLVALESALEAEPIEHFVLFSSAAALLPIPGQANYAAANAFLDGWAERRRAGGRPAISINWGVWDDLGMARGLGADEQFSARGFGRITPVLADAALKAALTAADCAAVVVLPVLHETCRADLFAPATGSLLASLLKPRSTGGDRTSESWADELRCISRGADRQYELEMRLREEVARIVKRAADRIDTNTSFRALGLDSLMGVELRNRLRTLTGIALSATVVWNYPTVAALAAHLADRMDLRVSENDPIAPRSGGPRDADLDSLLLELVALPDDEARRLLEGQN